MQRSPAPMAAVEGLASWGWGWGGCLVHSHDSRAAGAGTRVCTGLLWELLPDPHPRMHLEAPGRSTAEICKEIEQEETHQLKVLPALLSHFYRMLN